MIGRAHTKFCVAELEQFLPKVADEQWVSIVDQAMRHSMNFPNNVHEKDCNSVSREVWLELGQVDFFWEAVKNYQGRCVSTKHRETHSEVKEEVLSWTRRDW